jgi:hypothetical protein
MHISSQASGFDPATICALPPNAYAPGVRHLIGAMSNSEWGRLVLVFGCAASHVPPKYQVGLKGLQVNQFRTDELDAPRVILNPLHLSVCSFLDLVCQV